MKSQMLALAIALATTGCFAQQTVTVEKSTSVDAVPVAPASTTVKTETTEKSSTSNAAGTVTKTSTSSSSSYTTRLESAYRYAGVTDADIVKLRDLDMQVMEARRANQADRVKQYYALQTRILKPEQVTKVRTYLTEHPVAAGAPAYEVTSYEEVPTGTGVSVNTPLGNVGVGVNTGTKVVEKKEVVPAQ
jgi:hypothetical protein